jgi:hypothetical protein
MPFEPLPDALEQRTRDRVIRADDEWIMQARGQPGFAIASGAIKRWRHDTKGGLLSGA